MSTTEKDANMKSVLITGSAGFIGSHLTQRAQNAGWTVTGIDNFRSGTRDRLCSHQRFIEADIGELSESEWLNLTSESDVIVHLAAEKYNSSKSTPERLVKTNVDATYRAFSAAAKTKTKVVFASSLYVYGSGYGRIGSFSETDLPKPHTLYGASKLFGEGALESLRWEQNLQSTTFRLFFIYGPNQYADGGYKSVIVKNFERMLSGESPQITGDGQQTLDYLFVDDCVEALLLAMDKNITGTFNLSSASGSTINDLTRLMIGVTSDDYLPERIDADWTLGTARVGQNRFFRSVSGWTPKVSLDQGLSAVWQGLINRN